MVSPSPFWQGRRLWVIGGSTGIGRAVVERAAALGARTAASARKENELRELCASLPGSGHHALPLDVMDEAALVSAKDVLVAEWGGIDTVIYCAGAYKEMRGFAIDLATAQIIIDTNLKGALNTLSAAIPQLLAQGKGQLALTASVAGYIGLPNGLAYGASKAALINLAESLRCDLGDKGIDVRVINPGFVKTPMTASNSFPMPFLISAEEAAECITRGLEKPGFEIHFPKRFTLGLKLIRMLPYPILFPLLKKITGL